MQTQGKTVQFYNGFPPGVRPDMVFIFQASDHPLSLYRLPSSNAPIFIIKERVGRTGNIGCNCKHTKLFTHYSIAKTMNMIAQALTCDSQACPWVCHDVSLSDREQTVLSLISQGNSLQQIADYLGIHRKTVSAHKTKAMQKLNLSNNIELFYWSKKHLIGFMPKSLLSLPSTIKGGVESLKVTR
ncbi:hypothetical protein BHU62_11935 [Serratia marcescens]|uniref:HTH luxR-type domain-containing protein n=2 Tax=Serratia marcescens TaxID=615 RepID=A0A1Q4P0F3_SERMA|nr:hypothetical protein BHU62_11935 [Serratia marcescens]